MLHFTSSGTLLWRCFILVG